MRIAKSAKRLLSALTVTTLLVSGIVVAPKAKAAATDPAVTVKGATLKLEGNEAGKQSMRIGVEVSNASKATECGIDLEIGGVKKTISTADAKYQKIYEKDEEQDLVIYTVVVKNIPSNKFDTNIKATGLVKAVGATENTTSPSATKSVNEIVESIGGELVDGYVCKSSYSLDVTKEIVKRGTNDYATGFRKEQGDNDERPVAAVPETSGSDNVIKMTGKGAIRFQFFDAPDSLNLYKVVARSSTDTMSFCGKETAGDGEWHTLTFVDTAVPGNWSCRDFGMKNATETSTCEIKSFEVYKVFSQKQLPATSIIPKKVVLTTTKELLEKDYPAESWKFMSDCTGAPDGFSAAYYRTLTVKGKIYRDKEKQDQFKEKPSETSWGGAKVAVNTADNPNVWSDGINDNAIKFDPAKSSVQYTMDENGVFTMVFDISAMEGVGSITAQLDTNVIKALVIDSITLEK